MDCRSNQAHSSSVFTCPSNELERTEESAAERGSKSIGADQRRPGGRGFERRGLPTRGDKSVALPYNSEPLEWSSRKEEDRERADGNEMNNMTDARAPKRKYNSEEEIGQSIVSAEAQLSKKLSHDARIVRVSRTSGGKDRHSKVLTTRGLRDRRVRLSVSTAIQFYDLQDRLGFDQPSKAVEWLIKAAADAIDELPVLNTSEIQIHHRRHAAGAGAFSNAVPKENAHFLPYGSSVAINAAESSTNDSQSSKEGQCDEVLAVKSSSSTSEQDGSKGPDCSTLSRSESRVKARKRARERTMEKFSGSTSTSNIFSNYSFAGVLPPLGTLRNHYPHTDKYRPRGDLQVQCKRRNETQTSHWGNDIADDNEDEDHRHLLMAAAAMQPSASSAANSSGIAAILSHLNLQRNPEVTASGHGSSQQKHPVGNVTAAFAAGSNNNSNSFLLSSIDQDVLVQEHFAVNPAISNDMNLMISMPGISGRETLQSNSTSYVQPSPSHIQRMSSAEPSQFIFTNAGDAHYQGFHDAARMMHRIRDQFSFDEGSRDSPHDLKRNRSKHDQH